MGHDAGDERQDYVLFLARPEGLDEGKRVWGGHRSAWRRMGMPRPVLFYAQRGGQGKNVLGAVDRQQSRGTEWWQRNAIFHRRLGWAYVQTAGQVHALDRLWPR